MTIEQSVFTALNTVSISAYPAQAPQGTTPPYVVYRRISTGNHDTLAGAGTIDQARIQFNCYGANYSGAKSLAASVKAAIVAGFGARAVKVHESDQEDDGRHWVWIDYSIWKKL